MLKRELKAFKKYVFEKHFFYAVKNKGRLLLYIYISSWEWKQTHLQQCVCIWR